MIDGTIRSRSPSTIANTRSMLKRPPTPILRSLPMHPRKHVHPFPARMAPEVALDKIELLTDPGATVLDPMCGSGTVVRLASDAERFGIGVDLDPLAVIITRT